MICYVDIEHEERLEDEEKRSFHLAERADIKRRLEESSGKPCRVQHYSRVTRQRLRDWGARALIVGLNRTDWADYSEADLAEMYHIIRTAELPMIGLCGGCQLIALAHGAPLGPIRRLREGEDDPSPDYAPGYFKEWGFVPVRVVQPDPLFDGLGEEPVFHEEHYWEVKESPPRFKVLASTDECRIQVIKHVEKLVYGTQFHPERYTEEQPDGRQLLVNFFKLAGILEKGESGAVLATMRFT
jgi:GMP synthase-like glutamine amidotransferase